MKSFDEGKLDLHIEKQKNFIEFVGRTRNNNGIKGYVQKLEIKPNLENIISISQIGTIVAQIRKENGMRVKIFFLSLQKKILKC